MTRSLSDYAYTTCIWDQMRTSVMTYSHFAANAPYIVNWGHSILGIAIEIERFWWMDWNASTMFPVKKINHDNLDGKSQANPVLDLTGHNGANISKYNCRHIKLPKMRAHLDLWLGSALFTIQQAFWHIARKSNGLLSPKGTWRIYNVALTSMQRMTLHTLSQRCASALTICSVIFLGYY